MAKIDDLINTLASARVKNYSYDANGARHNMASLENPNGRLGFVQAQNYANPQIPNYYGAGIDNLNALLGNNTYAGEYNLPLGMTGELEYDGDTLAGGVNVPSKEYYIAALLDMLNNKR